MINLETTGTANHGGPFYFYGGTMKSKNNDKPVPGKIYALTGGYDTPCIAAGNTWKESEVKVIENDKGQKEFHFDIPDKIATIKVVK